MKPPTLEEIRTVSPGYRNLKKPLVPIVRIAGAVVAFVSSYFLAKHGYTGWAQLPLLVGIASGIYGTVVNTLTLTRQD
jgi:hypothetical protein